MQVDYGMEIKKDSMNNQKETPVDPDDYWNGVKTSKLESALLFSLSVMAWVADKIVVLQQNSKKMKDANGKK